MRNLNSQETKNIKEIRRNYLTIIECITFEDEKKETLFDTVEKKTLGYKSTYLKKELALNTVGYSAIPYWVMQVNSGICRNYAEEMLTIILEYQAERLERTDEINDLTAMVFHELKEWLVKLSGYAANDIDKCIADVSKRIKFLKVLKDPEIFPQGWFSGTTRVDLFRILLNTLESKVLPYLNSFTYGNAKEQFEQLCIESDILLKCSIQILYLILMDKGEIIRGISLYRLETDNWIKNSRYKRAVQTFTGSCVTQLAFQCAAIVDSSAEEDMGKNINYNQVTFGEDFKEIGELSLNWLISYKEKTKLGIDSFFFKEDQREVLEAFIALFDLIFDFSKLVSIVKEGHEIANIGNTLLLYGFLKNKTEFVLKTYKIFLDELSNKIDIIKNKINNNVSGRIVEEDLKRNSKKSDWLINYEIADCQIQSFKYSSDKISHNLESIKIFLGNTNLNKLLKEAEKKYKNYTNRVSTLYGQLKIKYSNSIAIPLLLDSKKMSIAYANAPFIEAREEIKVMDVNIDAIDLIRKEKNREENEEKKEEKHVIEENKINREMKNKKILIRFFSSAKKNLYSNKNKIKLPTEEETILKEESIAKDKAETEKVNRDKDQGQGQDQDPHKDPHKDQDEILFFSGYGDKQEREELASFRNKIHSRLLKGEAYATQMRALTSVFNQIKKYVKNLENYDDSWLFSTLRNGYDLELISSLPENDKNKAVNFKIYLSDNGEYVVRDPQGIVQTGSFNKALIENSDLASKINDTQFVNSILEITSKAGQTPLRKTGNIPLKGVFYHRRKMGDPLVGMLNECESLLDNLYNLSNNVVLNKGMKEDLNAAF